MFVGEDGDEQAQQVGHGGGEVPARPASGRLSQKNEVQAQQQRRQGDGDDGIDVAQQAQPPRQQAGGG